MLFPVTTVNAITTHSLSDISENNSKNHYKFTELTEEERIAQVKETIKQKYSLSDEQVDNLTIKRAADTSHQSSISDLIVPFYHREYLGEELRWVSGIPAGQPNHGVSFQNGGTIYWEEGWQHSTSVSVSVGYGPVSVAVSLGTKVDRVTGYGMWCTPGELTKLGIKKLIKFVGYRITGDASGSIYINEEVTTQEILQLHFYNAL